ncbi:hypothetical protein E1B28_005728 [Marasmius oreades]|uniref:Peptidase S1 domain-containing protein n=1 Tax=Marasmius oreades TaxID=181124 RepID=A0A9P7UUJ6_9AGAR|nr:uncharacterized protein E1B28_005728 [Marasmius oreades]KAG7094922.1 hypothetical protein E1B28_005728 [Marasmius oreades]
MKLRALGEENSERRTSRTNIAAREKVIDTALKTISINLSVRLGRDLSHVTLPPFERPQSYASSKPSYRCVPLRFYLFISSNDLHRRLCVLLYLYKLSVEPRRGVLCRLFGHLKAGQEPVSHLPDCPPFGRRPRTTRLTDKYSNAYSDFYGSGTPCVYKSGPSWHVRKGPQAQGIYREARPVYRHTIGRTWLSIGRRIYHELDSIGIKWTSINPLAYADAGEAKPFCSLILSIGVKPHSLQYDAAVTAANVVKKILDEAGFPTIEVAFVESVVTRSVAAGPKLLSFDPLDDLPDLRKPFITALGLSIAPLKHPHFEGTAALYFRLKKDDKRIAMLTCAHVARPPPIYPNTSMTHRNSSQPHEFIALGNMGYNNAVNAMMGTIGDLLYSIKAWNDELGWLGEPVEGENSKVTERRKEYLDLVAKATKKIEEVKALHDEVINYHSKPDQRVVGFLLHSEKIEVSVKPHNFTNDWALIELYNEKIDWATFKGNKIYVGGNLSIADYGKTMFPNPVDQDKYCYPRNGLLQAYGVVQDNEIHNPQHLDVHGGKCLFVVKNGLATGTTVGCANGLESFTRIYNDYGIEHTSIEIAVLPYNKMRGKFSDAGDSGSIVLDRDGRIVGILTGGAGPTDGIDITYLTPYRWVEQQIKARYPDCFLYEVVP